MREIGVLSVRSESTDVSELLRASLAPLVAVEMGGSVIVHIANDDTASNALTIAIHDDEHGTTVTMCLPRR